MGRKKLSSKQDKAAQRRLKKNRQKDKNKIGEQEGDEGDMRAQLERLGLALKEISGDGNCLFRALADQLYGNSKAIGGYHLKLRREVVDYMRHHRDDFEPFVDEDVTFDRHLQLLEQDGTYAGQDAIVAFSRLYGVTIVIHQVNEPLWQIHGSADGQTRCAKELHISYHNGDHYNSVRRIGDLNSNEPANLKIDIVHAPSESDRPGAESDDEDSSEVLSDYENSPNAAELQKMADDVRSQTGGSTDFKLIHEILEVNGYSVQRAVEKIMSQKPASQNGRQGPSSQLWSEEGTGSRIFGDEVAKAATAKSQKSPNPNSSSNTSKKESHFQKKKSRRKGESDEKQPVVTLVPTLQTLSL